MFESTALRPPPPDTDTDSFPLLTLQDCTITRFRRSTPEQPIDLFQIPQLGPFRAHGVLPSPLPRKHRSLALRPLPPDGAKITIPKVETYSIELLRDGEIVIWILGASAWYKVVPSKEYGPIFKDMVEKARVWMWLQEWRDGKNRAPLWEEMVRTGLWGRTQRACRKAVGLMAQWLCWQMVNPEHEPYLWEETEVWTELVGGFPDFVEEAKAFYDTTPTPRAKNGSKATVSSTTTTTTATRSTRSRKRKRPETPPPESEESSDEEMDDAEEDDDDDDDIDDEEEARTPSPHTSPPSQHGKTVSSKGRSILRPRGSTFPLASPSPDDEAPPPSPTIPTRPRYHDSLRWRCGKCDFQVANARTRDGRGEVERHYATHGQVFSKALETVELEAGSAESGVRNLLNKLREMEQRWEESRPSPLKGLGE